jgi:bifunctional non-homologous end joining protein LigD
MLKRKLPAGFVVPAQPVERDRPPTGREWVHEIKHDGYRVIVHCAGATPRLYSRNGHDLSARFPAIAAAAGALKSDSFTIDGEAVVLGPDGLSRFDELRRRDGAKSAVLFAFDLLELDGRDLRPLPLLERKAALTRLLKGSKAGIILNEHLVEDGPTVFAHACKLGAEGTKRVDAPYHLGKARRVKGVPRSDRKTNSDCGGSRCSRRRARSSTLWSACVAGVPRLTRQTCSHRFGKPSCVGYALICSA